MKELGTFRRLIVTSHTELEAIKLAVIEMWERDYSPEDSTIKIMPSIKEENTVLFDCNGKGMSMLVQRAKTKIKTIDPKAVIRVMMERKLIRKH